MPKINEVYNKKTRTERVIQFGAGGFMRGFFDWMIQKMNDAGTFDGSVVNVQPLATGKSDVLTAQDCMYTHVIRGAEGVERSVIDVISRCIKPYEEWDAYIALASQPELRFITSNTTEAGIEFRESDRIENRAETSFPGKLTQLLLQRYKLGLPGFIVLPCELIERNGDTLRGCVLRYAELWKLGADFSEWVKRENVFCNTLVDRINTGFPKGEDLGLPYEDLMVNASEFYHLWVIETDCDIGRELPFARTGLNVIVTKDQLELYRTRKVRILNGAHTSLVPHALLSGLDTVGACMKDSAMLAHVRACVFDEIIPTLDLPREELCEYAENVLTRFSNPYIKHYLQSIALNSVSKFRVRVLPSILEYKKRFGVYPPTLTFSFARLIEFYKRGTPDDVPEVTEFMRRASVAEILAKTEFWGTDLSDLLPMIVKNG